MSGTRIAREPIHAAELPQSNTHPRDWTLAEWQGVMEELHYQHKNQREGLFLMAHDAIEWLVAFYLARRLNA